MPVKDILSEDRPKLTRDQREQGSPVSGYEEHGPYHCEDCIHRVGGKDSDLPFCLHPYVLLDPKMRKRRTTFEDQQVVQISMERGCCKFVNQGVDKDAK